MDSSFLRFLLLASLVLPPILSLFLDRRIVLSPRLFVVTRALLLHVFGINPILMHRFRQNCFLSIRDRLLVGRFLQRRFAAIVLIDGRVVGLSLLLNVTEELFRNCKGIRWCLGISAGGSLLRFVLSYSLIDDFLHGLYRDELWSSV